MPDQPNAQESAEVNTMTNNDSLVTEAHLAETPPEQVVTPQQPAVANKTSKFMLIILALLLLAVGIGIGYVLANRSTTASTKPADYSAAPDTIKPAAADTAVDSVFYATFAEKQPPKLFRQAVNGSAQQVILPGTPDTTNGFRADSYGQNVAIAVGEGVFVSTDGGRNFVKRASLTPPKTGTDLGPFNGETVTSLRFSSDGKRIVYATIQSSGANLVRSMKLDGTDVQLLFTSEAPGVFITHFDTAKNQLVYSAGCYFCDGNLHLPLIMNLTTKTSKKLSLTTGANEQLGSWTVNKAGTKLIYALGVSDNRYEAGVGDPFAPPYTIKEYDLQSDQSTQLYRIEPLYEKSTNDPTTYKTYSISVGYLADTDMPYVKAIDGLYALKGSSATKLLDMTSDTGVDYALSTQIAISQYSPSTNSTSYSLYELKTKKSTALLTDSATILCFTTK